MATSQRGATTRGETRARGQDPGTWTPRRPAPGRSADPRAAAQRRTVVQHHVTLRKVDPWTVLKLSLIFYFCVLLVVMVGLTLFWTAINNMGLIETVIGFLAELQVEVAVDGGSIGRAVFFLGLLNVVIWSGINVFLAFLYNLVADLVGGLRVTVSEDD
ncbi:MAG TPA: DUF3566 domain-containing protein [Egibacteraceae bacterium]